MDTDYEAMIKNGKVRHMRVGPVETCETTGKEHRHVCVYLWKEITGGARNGGVIGGMFGGTHSWANPMRGRVMESEEYASKNGDDCADYGLPPMQGARHNLNEVFDTIKDGKLTADEICVENPEMFHQYGRTIDRLEMIALRRRWRTWMTECTWFCGESGSGKSHKCMEGFDPKTHFVKDLSVDWWDGYVGQEIVVLNEFRGEIKFSMMLAMIDKWPLQVKVRGKESVPFLAKKILISSVKTPEEVYKHSLDADAVANCEQWTRRVEVTRLMKRNFSET